MGKEIPEDGKEIVEYAQDLARRVGHLRGEGFDYLDIGTRMEIVMSHDILKALREVALSPSSTPPAAKAKTLAERLLLGRKAKEKK